MSSSILARNLLRRSIKDIYGRFVGHIIGISFNAMGDVTAIQVDQGSKGLAEYPFTRVSMNRNFVVLIPEWKVDTKIIQKEWSSIQKRIFALDNLLRSGKISREIYESMRKRYENAINRLSKKHDAVLSDLRGRYDELKFQVEKFERSIVNIELEQMVGGIDDQTYKTAYDSMKSLVETAISEKKDIEVALNQLSKLNRA